MKHALVLIAALAATPAAYALDFYSVPVKATLYYKNQNSTKRMGSVKGKLEAREDGEFATLTLGDKAVPMELSRFSIHRHSDCLFCDDSGPARPNVSLKLSGAVVSSIAHEA